jgi:hypothetical protein
MDFVRGLQPKESLDIGWKRKLKKGDKFRVTFPETADNPPILREAIAHNDEERFEHTYIEKVDCFGQSEIDSYTVRQVEFLVYWDRNGNPEDTEIGIILVAEMRTNCEWPEWRQIDNPEF